MKPFFPFGYSPLDAALDDINGNRLPSSDEGEKGCPGFGEFRDSEAGLMEGISDIQDLCDPESLYECGLNDKGRPRFGEISDSEAGLMDGVTEADLFFEFNPSPPSTKTLMTWGTAPLQSAKQVSLIKRCGSELSGDSEESTATDIQDLFDPESLYECGLNDKGRPRFGEISDSEAGLMDGVTEADLFYEFNPSPPSTKTVMTWGTAPFQSATKVSLIKRFGSDLSGDSEDSTAVSSGASSSFPTLSATGMSATKKDCNTVFYALSDFPDDDEKSISPFLQSEILAQSNRVGLYRGQ